MSDNRKECLFSIVRNIEVPICLVTDENRWDFEIEGHKFHEAYQFLSETHKADYLRCYLMHHHGGGYTDIKMTTKSWRPFFQLMDTKYWDLLGYPEIGPHGVAPVGGDLEDELRKNWQELVGMCAYISRRNTGTTTIWMERVHEVLDRKLSDLQKYPASWPQDAFGRLSPTGNASKYPLKWTEILGDILHPLCLRNKNRIGKIDLAPHFSDYR